MALSSLIEYVQALDTSATDGSGKTALAFGDITAKYLTQAGTLTSLTTETITTLGTYQAPTSAAHIRIKELANTDPTKGIYEVHFHDTQLAAAGKRLKLFLSATGARFIPLHVDLLAHDVQSLGASTQSLTDLKDFADTGYDPATHKVADVALLNGAATVVLTDDSLTAAKIATDAIDAASIKADAVTKIQNGLASQTSVDDLPTNAELATALAAADDAVLTQVALVKTATDRIPSDPADASDIASAFGTVNTTLSTIAGYVDTEVAAIKVVTDKFATMIQVSGSVWQYTTDSLENGPSGSGGSSIEVSAPLVGRVGTVGEVVDSQQINAYHYGPIEAGPFAVFEEDAVTPLDMSAYATELMFVVFEVITNSATGVKSERVIARLITPDVVVGGAGNNQVTLANTTPCTAEIGRFRWAIRRTTTGNKALRMQGWIVVDPCGNTA